MNLILGMISFFFFQPCFPPPPFFMCVYVKSARIKSEAERAGRKKQLSDNEEVGKS